MNRPYQGQALTESGSMPPCSKASSQVKDEPINNNQILKAPSNMRAETEAVTAQIKQSLELLRRHL